MSSAAIWRGDVIASALSSAQSGQSGTVLREATIDSRLDALKSVALTLLDAVDSLRTAQPTREQSLRLQDEVQRFETDLIRSALERTGGNQARAARLLGVKHTTLNAKIKRYRIRCGGFGAEGNKSVGDREMAA